MAGPEIDAFAHECGLMALLHLCGWLGDHSKIWDECGEAIKKQSRSNQEAIKKQSSVHRVSQRSHRVSQSRK
jgi:hypothetical protein